MTPLAPFVPTPAICIKAALKLLAIDQMRSKPVIFYDLGGGDGRVSFHALNATINVSENPENRALIKCVENDGRLGDIIKKDFKKWCRTYNIGKDDIRRFELIQSDILDTDFSDATHIYTYLTQEGIDDLTPKLNEKLKKGTKIVSCEYPITNWSPLEVVKDNALDLYVYQFGTS